MISLNTGRIQSIPYRGRTMKTAIFKQPVDGPRQVTRLFIEGDEQADLKYHGGEDQAVYAYPSEHYPAWREELKRPELEYGGFGENLTTFAMLEEDVCIGDIYRIGTAVLQVSQPRVPCYKLAVRLRATRVLKRMLETSRCGFYLRVLEEGQLQSGDAIELIQKDAMELSVADVHRMRHFREGTEARRSQAPHHPALSAFWREKIKK